MNLKKLLEILELCKKLSKSSATEKTQDHLYKLKDGTVSSMSKQSKIPKLKIEMPKIPTPPGMSIPTGARQKNKISGSEV